MSTKRTDKLELNSEELITRDDMKDSPFHVIGVEGKYFGAMGNFRITEKMEDKVSVKKELKKITWDRILQVVLILIEKQKEL